MKPGGRQRRWGWFVCVAVLAMLGLCSCAATTRLCVETRAEGLEIIVSPASAPEPLERVRGDTSVTYRVSLPGSPVRQSQMLACQEPAAEVWLASIPDGGPVLEVTVPYEYPAEVISGGGEVRLRLRTVGDESFTTELGRGVSLTSTQRCRPDRVVWYHVVRIDPVAVERVRIVAAGESITVRKPLSELAAGALAGINGGYFDLATGAPLGALKVDGEWVRTPLFRRTALLLSPEERPRIASVDWRAVVHDGPRAIPIESINSRPSEAAQAVVLSRRWPFERTFAGFTAYPLPEQGLTLYTREPLTGAPRVELRSEPDVDGSILGAGPLLVHEGQVRITARFERFRPDVTETVNARAGLGLTTDMAMLFVFAEGRRPRSVGFGLEEWARLLAELGCAEAVNLDGAYSATLVAGGEVIGEPASGGEVPLPTAIVVGADG